MLASLAPREVPWEDQLCLPLVGAGRLPWSVRLQHPLRVIATHTLTPPVGFCGFFGDMQVLRNRPHGVLLGPCSHAGPALCAAGAPGTGAASQDPVSAEWWRQDTTSHYA